MNLRYVLWTKSVFTDTVPPYSYVIESMRSPYAEHNESIINKPMKTKAESLKGRPYFCQQRRALKYPSQIHVNKIKLFSWRKTYRLSNMSAVRVLWCYGKIKYRCSMTSVLISYNTFYRIKTCGFFFLSVSVIQLLILHSY